MTTNPRVPERMRIVHVVGGLDAGGAEVMLGRLVAALDPARYEQLVVSLMAGGVIAENLRALQIPIFEIGWKRGHFGARGAAKLAGLGQKLAPDLISGWLYHGNLAGNWLAGFAGRKVPVIWNIHHTVTDLSLERPLTRVIIRSGPLLSRRASRIVYVAHSAAESHHRLGYPAAKTVVIPNGFDLGEFRPDPDARLAVRAQLGLTSELVVGAVGRYHPLKDYPNLLRAAALVHERRPDLVFVLVGRGLDDSNAELTSQLAELGLESCVRLLGERRDVASIMASLDVFVLPSRSEAFPIVVGEAMATGLAVVATAVGDVPHLLGDAGCIVPPQDPRALCDAILSIVDLAAADRISLGARARAKVVAEFSLPAIVHRYKGLYEELWRP